MSDNSSNITTKTVNLGRLPVYCGIWSSGYNGGNGYHLYNKVTFFGSEFINKVEGNTNAPANIFKDTDGTWIGYTINPGWDVTANAMDASIYAAKYSRTGKASSELAYGGYIKLIQLYDNTTGASHLDYGCCVYGHNYTVTYGMVLTTPNGDKYQASGYPKFFSDILYTHEISSQVTGVVDDYTVYGQTKPMADDFIIGNAITPISMTLNFYSQIIYGIGSDVNDVYQNGTKLDYPTSDSRGITYRTTNNSGSANKFYLLIPKTTHAVQKSSRYTMNGCGMETDETTTTIGNQQYDVIMTRALIKTGKTVSILAE